MKRFLTIGEVSKIYKTTNRQLRFYEEIGLLFPEKINKENGYRYYSEKNCELLGKILCLKDIGFILNDISSYFSGDDKTKLQILKKYKDKTNRLEEVIKTIITNKDFDLKFALDVTYVGNNVRLKDLNKLKGTWKLSGVFSTIKDAKNEQNAIDVFTPYRFMSFDEFGNSPWFYSADEKFIVFDTWRKPTKEIYQIIQNKLYIKVNNPLEHVFGMVNNPMKEKHVLVFEKYSENFEDYKQFMFKDKGFEKFEQDNDFIGVWKLKNDNVLKYLIVHNDGVVDICSIKGLKTFKWSKGKVYNEELNAELKYSIKNNVLIIEDKSKIYSFCGVLKGLEEYIKI